ESDPPGKRQLRPTIAIGSCWSSSSLRSRCLVWVSSVVTRLRYSRSLSSFVVMSQPELVVDEGEHVVVAGRLDGTRRVSGFLGRVDRAERGQHLLEPGGGPESGRLVDEQARQGRLD